MKENRKIFFLESIFELKSNNSNDSVNSSHEVFIVPPIIGGKLTNVNEFPHMVSLTDVLLLNFF